MNYLDMIGRREKLFSIDISSINKDLFNKVANSSFLVIGGAGSIGQEATRNIQT